MISGNCNRSPQSNTMGPPGPAAQMYNPQAFKHQQQQQHPHLLFMSGGNVRTFPQMSRGFSMLPNRGHPTAVVQCNIQQGFGNSFGYQVNPAAQMFHPPHHHLYQQPQVISHQHQSHHHHHHQQQQQQQHHHHNHPHHLQQQYVPQQLVATPTAANHDEPSSGFINGIKNMVKGIINPLNCDFYTDHHKYYNPKYRNNYMMDLKADNMSYQPIQRLQQPESHVKSIVVDLELNKPATNPPQSQECSQNSSEVKAIFNSDDFPELPAPRRSRSATPAKAETSTSQKPCEIEKEKSPPKESPTRDRPLPKATFFEIMCTTTPSGRRPTFGGRLKVVPPPFTLNATCRNRNKSKSTSTSGTNQDDCDIEGDSFVIFSNNDKSEDCPFSSFNRPPRQRQLSECSDDSFVVVFTDDANLLGGLKCVNDDDDDDIDEDDDEDDDDEDDDDDDNYSDLSDSEEETSSEEDEEDTSDDEHDGVDVVDSGLLDRHNKTDRNKCDNGDKISLLCSQQIPLNGVVSREHEQFDSGFDEKKVTFNPHPVVHVMHAWNYAYRAARKGHWEDFARDRTRFHKRIERTSVYLNPILTPEHREKVYQSRFCDDAATNNQNQTQQQESPNPKLDVGSQHRASASCNDENNQNLPKLTKLPDCASF